MNLWIRIQNKEQLIKINKDISINDTKKYKKMLNSLNIDVTDSEYDKVDGIDIIRDAFNVDGYMLTTDKLLLGIYKTTERALEVLDEIQNEIKNQYLLKPKETIELPIIESAKNYYEHLNNIDIIVCDDNFEIKPINTNVIIYEMPKE